MINTGEDAGSRTARPKPARRARKKGGRRPAPAQWKQMSPEERKQAVIQAILHVMAKHGVQGTTTARIAAAVGVSEPTIYRVFPSRRAMLRATAEKLWQQRCEELESFTASDAMDYLRKLSEQHTQGIQRTRVSRYLQELSLARPSDGLRDYLRSVLIAEAERLAQIVEQGKKEGCIRPDADSWEVAWRIMMVHWLEATALRHGLEDILLRGFSTRVFKSILEDIAIHNGAAD